MCAVIPVPERKALMMYACLRLCGLCFFATAAATGHGLDPSVDMTPMSNVAINMGPPYYSGAVLPAPKHVEYQDKAVVLANGPAGQWRCYPDISIDGPARTLMERLLFGKFEAYAAQFPKLDNTIPGNAKLRLTFTTAVNWRTRKDLLRFGALGGAADLPPQGYLLEVSPAGVLCIGADNAGLVNGLASFLQLVHVRNSQLVARCVSIRDWPIFQVRYVSEYHLPGNEFFDWMMRYKINGFAASYRAMQWEGLTSSLRSDLRRTGEYIEQYDTMHFMAQFHVGGRGEGKGSVIDCGNAADVARLLATITETIQLAHAEHIMICYDDVVPVLQPMAAQKWKHPVQAHGALMDEVYRHVKRISPDTAVSFCSPYYQGRRHKRWRAGDPALPEMLEYLAGLRGWDNSRVQIVWTGSATESRSITREDVAHYRYYIGKQRELFYWDNTWHYHQPLSNFHARYFNGFVDDCAGRSSYVNINATLPIGRFFAITANDYYWNPSGHDAIRARDHATAQVMGPQAVPAARDFFKLRGDDYLVNFAARVELDALKQVLTRIEHTSLDPGIAQYCWSTYRTIAKKRAGGE